MSAESLLSIPAVLPAVPGGGAPASGAGDDGASAFEGMLAVAVGKDATPTDEAAQAPETTSAAPVVAMPLSITLPILGETEPPTPEVLPGNEPAEFKAVLASETAQPLILTGPSEETPPTSAPLILTGPGAETPEPAAPTVLTGPGEEAPQPAQPLILTGPGTEAQKPAAPLILTGPGAEVQKPAPPLILSGPGVEAQTPALPLILTGPGADAPTLPVGPVVSPPATDKSSQPTKSKDPETLPGPTAEAHRGATGPNNPMAGVAGKAGSPADAAQTLPPPTAEATAPTAATGGQVETAPLDDSAPALARDASLSSLSRATIETTAQIAAQITRRLEGRSTRFEMALTPEGLGRVDVSLDIDADGQLAARLAFDNPLAALDMRGRVDELRRQLEDQGFKLADDAFQFTERDPQSRGDGFDGRRERAFARSNRLNDDADLEISAPVAGRWMSLSLTPDRVDLKV